MCVCGVRESNSYVNKEMKLVVLFGQKGRENYFLTKNREICNYSTRAVGFFSSCIFLSYFRKEKTIIAIITTTTKKEAKLAIDA